MLQIRLKNAQPSNVGGSSVSQHVASTGKASAVGVRSVDLDLGGRRRCLCLDFRRLVPMVRGTGGRLGILRARRGRRGRSNPDRRRSM